MASFSLSHSIITPPFKHCRSGQALQVRAQSFRDGGRSSNRVDANLSVLRERIEQVKMKEKLERCCTCEYGWNYAAVNNNNHKVKKDDEVSEFLEVLRMVGSTLGFTWLTGTFFLCLVSVFVHLSQ